MTEDAQWHSMPVSYSPTVRRSAASQIDSDAPQCEPNWAPTSTGDTAESISKRASAPPSDFQLRIAASRRRLIPLRFGDDVLFPSANHSGAQSPFQSFQKKGEQ